MALEGICHLLAGWLADWLTGWQYPNLTDFSQSHLRRTIYPFHIDYETKCIFKIEHLKIYPAKK